MTSLSSTTARRQTYTEVLAQLRAEPNEDFVAHVARMAPLGIARDVLMERWAEREAVAAHPISDPEWEIVYIGEVCKAAQISYGEAERRGAMDALRVPGVAVNMTTRDAIDDWCASQGITPTAVTTDADRRLTERAGALARILERV